jgi:aerobic carbon-monoxide dehydrogenase small subunit
MKISVTVNGKRHDSDVPAAELLVEHLREVLGLTGTKVGCDTGQCGSCVVRVDGTSVKSCLMLTVQADGAEVETIESVAGPGELSPLQEAMLAEHATQCGFCTPGMVMSLSDLLARNPEPAECEIRHWLSGNICRCTGYHSVVRGVQRVAAEKGVRP